MMDLVDIVFLFFLFKRFKDLTKQGYLKAIMGKVGDFPLGSLGT